MSPLINATAAAPGSSSAGTKPRPSTGGPRLMQALKFLPFKKTAFGTMQIDLVANITVSASLQIIFATDTRSSLAGMVIGFPRTLCFAAKTVRSLGE